MKAYKVTLLIIDHDKVGPEQMKQFIELARYPNYCLHPHVMDIEERDIGRWHDNHKLNNVSLAVWLWERGCRA